MNRKELATVLNVSPTAISHWEKEGMPVITKAGQGSPNNYNLEECLIWIRKNGKGRSVRADRPGESTRVNALAQTMGNNNAPPANGWLMLSEKEVQDAMIFGEMQGKSHAFEWIAENFLIAAASLIRFGGLDPETAVNLGFHIAYSFQSAACTIHNIERQDHNPESRVAEWLKGDKETLAALAAMAVEMQRLWIGEHHG